MTDAAGVAVDIYTYDPHGNSTTLTGNPFRYTGRRLDAETGLYYYRARYYSPALGRFLQTDPIGYGDGLNWYAYVGNDPVNGVDPTGESGESERCGGIQTKPFDLLSCRTVGFNFGGGDGGDERSAQSPAPASNSPETGVPSSTGSNAPSKPADETIELLGVDDNGALIFGVFQNGRRVGTISEGINRDFSIEGAASLVLGVGEAGATIRGARAAGASIRLFLGPKGPVFGQSRLGAQKAGFLNRGGKVRIGFTPFKGKAQFRVVIFGRKIDIFAIRSPVSQK